MGFRINNSLELSSPFSGRLSSNMSPNRDIRLITSSWEQKLSPSSKYTNPYLPTSPFSYTGISAGNNWQLAQLLLAAAFNPQLS